MFIQNIMQIRSLTYNIMDGILSRAKQYTYRQAADLLGLHHNTVAKYVKDGLLGSVVIRRRRWITETNLQNFIVARDTGLIDDGMIRR